MNRKMCLSVCLMCCALVSMIGCSFVRTSQPAKGPETVKEAQGGTIEWRERTWEFYAKDNGGVSYYFDKGAVSFPSRNIIHVWRRKVFSAQTATARHTASNQKEIIAFEEFDCTQDRYRSLEVQGLNWDGTTTQIFRKPSPWTPIFPDMADDYFLDNYCGAAKKAQ